MALLRTITRPWPTRALDLALPAFLSLALGAAAVLASPLLGRSGDVFVAAAALAVGISLGQIAFKYAADVWILVAAGLGALRGMACLWCFVLGAFLAQAGFGRWIAGSRGANDLDLEWWQTVLLWFAASLVAGAAGGAFSTLGWVLGRVRRSAGAMGGRA